MDVAAVVEGEGWSSCCWIVVNNGVVLLINNVKFIPFGLSFVAGLLVKVLLMLFVFFFM